MATPYGTFLPEGQSTNRPPLFSGSNYNYWKARMRIYIQATDYEVWKVIVGGPFRPTKTVNEVVVDKEEKEWDENDLKGVQLNAKAMNMLYCALDPAEFNRISACESAKEIWDKLEVTHEGTNQVKESKINMLVHKYELFKMMPGESISSMFTRFTDIVNGLKSLGKPYSNVDLVRKILRSLPKQWEPKVTAIIEAREDLTKYSLDELLGSLLTHEITMNLEEDQEPKKKSIALKCSTTSSKNDGDNSESSGSDEEMAMFTRKFKRFMRKKKESEKKFFKNDLTKKENNKADSIICYNCKKPGHIKFDCPQAKESSKKAKRRAMLAAWGNGSDESNSEEESDQANLCLMAHENSEVNSFDDSDDHFTYDELLDAFHELHDEFKKLGSKNSFLKKSNSSLLAENELLKGENDVLKEKVEGFSTNKISDLELENEKLKKEVENLKTTLSKFVKGRDTLDVILGKQRCIFDKAGLGFEPTKKQRFYQNFFVKATSSSCPFTTCNYCGKRGHILHSCPFKRNTYVGAKQVWVPKYFATNIQGPKQVWVPKTNV